MNRSEQSTIETAINASWLAHDIDISLSVPLLPTSPFEVVFHCDEQMGGLSLEPFHAPKVARVVSAANQG